MPIRDHRPLLESQEAQPRTNLAETGISKKILLSCPKDNREPHVIEHAAKII